MQAIIIPHSKKIHVSRIWTHAVKKVKGTRISLSRQANFYFLIHETFIFQTFQMETQQLISANSRIFDTGFSDWNAVIETNNPLYIPTAILIFNLWKTVSPLFDMCAKQGEHWVHRKAWVKFHSFCSRCCSNISYQSEKIMLLSYTVCCNLAFDGKK